VIIIIVSCRLLKYCKSLLHEAATHSRSFSVSGKKSFDIVAAMFTLESDENSADSLASIVYINAVGI